MISILNNQFPQILPPETFENFKKGLPKEMRKMVEKRHKELQRLHKEKEDREEIKLSRILDKDLLFRFAYVPFVIANLAWDYADTIITMAAMLKLSEQKKLCREVKRLKQEYDRYRSPYIDDAHKKSEEDNMYVFEDETKDIFKPYLHKLGDDIKKEYPQLDQNFVMYLQSIFQCHVVLLSIYKYVEEMNKRIEAIINHSIGDILPVQLRTIDKIVLQFAKDWPVSIGFQKQHSLYAEALSDSMLQIEFNDSDLEEPV